MVVDLVGGGDRLNKSASKSSRGSFLRAADLDHGELVTAEPRHAVVLSDGGRQPGADFLQQCITNRMSEGVVDVLETIEIEAEHRELVVRTRPAQSLLELLVKQHAIRQIGQRVMASH